MTIASEITRLQNDKAAMCAAIENKWVTVGNVTLDDYASCIDAIQQWWGSHWCVCVTLIGAWWGWWNSWTGNWWWGGEILVIPSMWIELPVSVEVWAGGSAWHRWWDTCFWWVVASWWWAGGSWWQYWISWNWMGACSAASYRWYWWWWCTFSCSSIWWVWAMSWRWGWWWGGSACTSWSYCYWCPWSCWGGSWWNWCSNGWAATWCWWWGWWKGVCGSTWWAWWGWLVIVCYPTDWSRWVKDLIWGTKTTSWTYTVHTFCRWWFLRSCDDTSFSFRYLAVWTWWYWWCCWWSWGAWWEVLCGTLNWIDCTQIPIVIGGRVTHSNKYCACSTCIWCYISARWWLNWQNWDGSTWASSWWWFIGGVAWGNWSTGTGISWWWAWAWWNWNNGWEWLYCGNGWSWLYWYWWWGGGWTIIYSSTWCLNCCIAKGVDWGWNWWYNSCAATSATNYWWWWGGAWAYSRSYWNWMTWIVKICYPLDWSWWIHCATGGGWICCVNWWKIHQFTSSWTFTIVN